eukprot:12911261-Prorocentrum_lima.AAC.1
MTFEELAKETGGHLRPVQFDIPAADVWTFRKLPGMADYDNMRGILNLLKVMWGQRCATSVWNEVEPFSERDRLPPRGYRPTDMAQVQSELW